MSETGELVAGAAAAFSDAVHALIGLRPDQIDRGDRVQSIVRASLYTELCEARQGERSSSGPRTGVPGSQAPGWTEALSLIVRIDTRVGEWCPCAPAEPVGLPVTVRRLWYLVDNRWCPEDVGVVRAMAGQVRSWVERARLLLPTAGVQRWRIRAVCPACGESTLLVPSDGEWVRVPVLEAEVGVGVSCAACETCWEPAGFAALAAQVRDRAA